jgi:hypothetical protein
MNVTVPSAAAPLNAPAPMVRRFAPNMTFPILLHPENVEFPMTWTFPAIVKFVLEMLEQFWNAVLSILVTESGIFMVPIDVQFRNALTLIHDKLPPRAIAGIFKQSLNA